MPSPNGTGHKTPLPFPWAHIQRTSHQEKKPMDSRRNKVCHLSPKARKIFVNICTEEEKKDLLLLVLITHKLCEIQITREHPIALPYPSVPRRTRLSAAWEHPEVDTTFSPLLSQLLGFFSWSAEWYLCREFPGLPCNVGPMSLQVHLTLWCTGK